ncbi:hypothetical protein BV25DRAFT_1843670 [Artomyces pyxidatus]|uniref:Uncharacterized protein n=1 Tax=Artomyces pyxidatus TaxID=48021 RepID=A0ACB8SDL1_9AGAM|nr:hypothetical protein BV25DRAFT_1843670 [Artomyces pyxidatus]
MYGKVNALWSLVLSTIPDFCGTSDALVYTYGDLATPGVQIKTRTPIVYTWSENPACYCVLIRLFWVFLFRALSATCLPSSPGVSRHSGISTLHRDIVEDGVAKILLPGCMMVPGCNICVLESASTQVSRHSTRF